MPSLARLYGFGNRIESAEPSRSAEEFMSVFRTCRPLLVDATQASGPSTIATDLGFANVQRGDWIVRGEDGETYVVDDAFFQRTFTPIQKYPWEQAEESRSYGC
jgi:hypothetical protein